MNQLIQPTAEASPELDAAYRAAGQENTSSIGSLEWPGATTSFERIKGFNTIVVHDEQTLVRLLAEAGSVEFTAGVSRYSGRLLINNRLLSGLNELCVNYSLNLEAILPFSGSRSQRLDNLSLVYLGRNAPERTSDQAEVLEALNNVATSYGFINLYNLNETDFHSNIITALNSATIEQAFVLRRSQLVSLNSNLNQQHQRISSLQNLVRSNEIDLVIAYVQQNRFIAGEQTDLKSSIDLLREILLTNISNFELTFISNAQQLIIEGAINIINSVLPHTLTYVIYGDTFQVHVNRDAQKSFEHWNDTFTLEYSYLNISDRQNCYLENYRIRPLSMDERRNPNIVDQYVELYRVFGWNRAQVIGMLENTDLVIVGCFRLNEASNQEVEVVSAGLAEVANIEISNNSTLDALRLWEITEAVTKAEYGGKGLYARVSQVLERTIYCENEFNPHGQGDMVYGETNTAGSSRGVQKAARRQHRIPALVMQQLFGGSGLLDQAVRIGTSDKYPPLHPAMLAPMQVYN